MERVGWREFEEQVGDYFGEQLGCEFAEVPCQVGPEHEHKFDLVPPNGNVIIECKSYTWTSGGNFPTAKVATANEAIFFLSRVKAERKMLVMQDDLDPDGVSLVQSYVERYGGLMDDVEVWRVYPCTDGPDTVEQVRDAGEIYQPQEMNFTNHAPSQIPENESSFSGKYAPLYEELADAEGNRVQYRFEDINRILDDPLPDSAYRYHVWWNESGHSHAEGWESIGWTVSSLDLSEEVVEFSKK